MDNEVISYVVMCRREGASLQQGMNFYPNRPHSVILMSRRSNAPYVDIIEPNGETLIYDGHDVPRRRGGPDPKSLDQQIKNSNGTLTQNGRFARATNDFKKGVHPPRLVRVYEKLIPGMWSYNGPFLLVGCWTEHTGVRSVFQVQTSSIFRRWRYSK